MSPQLIVAALTVLAMLMVTAPAEARPKPSPAVDDSFAHVSSPPSGESPLFRVASRRLLPGKIR